MIGILNMMFSYVQEMYEKVKNEHQEESIRSRLYGAFSDERNKYDSNPFHPQVIPSPEEFESLSDRAKFFRCRTALETVLSNWIMIDDDSQNLKFSLETDEDVLEDIRKTLEENQVDSLFDIEMKLQRIRSNGEAIVADKTEKDEMYFPQLDVILKPPGDEDDTDLHKMYLIMWYINGYDRRENEEHEPFMA
jgi:hypothetical protein